MARDTKRQTKRVAPRVGAWIEILITFLKLDFALSLPVWERGLKFDVLNAYTKYNTVAPRVGAWIEICW